jgi:hypothetical protein
MSEERHKMAGNTATTTSSEFENDQDILLVNEQLVMSSIHLLELAEGASDARRYLKELVYGLGAAICEVEAATGRCTFLSSESEIFLGRPADEWLNTPNFLIEIVHASERHLAPTFLPSPFDNQRILDYDFRALSDDDSVVYMRNIVRHLPTTQENPELLRCIFVDVTAEKATAKLLEDAYSREHAIAEALQRSVLTMPPASLFPGLLVNSLYRPASDESSVGGDFSDAFAFDHGLVALVLGDVMGHGLTAARFTGELKYALRGFTREHVAPGRILAQMNRYLCEVYRLHRQGLDYEGTESPLCLLIVVINPNTGEGSAAAAGMEHPLIVRSNGQVEEVEAGGMLLGVLGTFDYDQVSFKLEAGDSLIMTTDGVTEARHNGVFLGYEGLKLLANNGPNEGELVELGKSIVEGAVNFAGGTLNDDICLLLTRRVSTVAA